MSPLMPLKQSKWAVRMVDSLSFCKGFYDATSGEPKRGAKPLRGGPGAR